MKLRLFISGGRSIGTSAPAPVVPMSIQGSFPLGLTILISLCSRDSQESSAPQFKSINSSGLSLPYGPTHNILYMNIGKTIALPIWTFVSRVMSLLFNTLSRFVMAFLPRNKHLLISWAQSPSTLILEPKKIKFLCFHCFPIYLP